MLRQMPYPFVIELLIRSDICRSWFVIQHSEAIQLPHCYYLNQYALFNLPWQGGGKLPRACWSLWCKQKRCFMSFIAHCASNGLNQGSEQCLWLAYLRFMEPFRPLNERASSGEISAIRIRILWSIAGSTQISNSLI